MKNILKICLCTFVCALLIMSVASAQEGAMQASWEADYDEMNLIIRFQSPALYDQQVTAVMYPADAEPVLGNFCRVKEVTSLSGEVMSLTLKLGNDLTATDGRYKVKLQGNGISSGVSKEIIDVKILTPYNAGILLDRINGATIDNIAGILDEGDEELQIELAENPPVELMTTFLNIRNADYDGTFPSLNDVRNACKISDIIVYLQSDEVTVDGLCEKVENNAEFLGINVESEDYIKYKAKVYEKIISLKTSYNTTGINTFGLLAKAIEETVAVEAINDSTISELKNIVVAYKDAIGITDDSYNKFLGYSSETQSIVLRYVYNKNYNLITNIKADFEKGVDEVSNAESSGSGGGSGGSFGGGNASISGDTQQSVVTPEEKSFTDVEYSHWAYDFITRLHKTNILSGYPDGTFNPESTVTREEFVKMIISATGLYDKNAVAEFEDVASSHWAYRFVASANNCGIINGVTESEFGAGKPIVRQDVAVIAARIIDRFNGTGFSKAEGVNTDFTDDSDISDYAKAGVKVLVQSGIINGFEDGSFKPNDFLTRAQAAKIIDMLRSALS